MSRKHDPCKRHACQIQKCLQENNYQESKCGQVLEEMMNCCRKYGDRSLCCEGFMPAIIKERQSKDSEKTSDAQTSRMKLQCIVFTIVAVALGLVACNNYYPYYPLYYPKVPVANNGGFLGGTALLLFAFLMMMVVITNQTFTVSTPEVPIANVPGVPPAGGAGK